MLIVGFMLVSAMPFGSAAAGNGYGNTAVYMGDDVIDYMAAEILKGIDTAGKTQVEQIRAVYDWVIKTSSRDNWDGTEYFDYDTVSAQANGAFADRVAAGMKSGDIVIRPELSYLLPSGGAYETSYDSNYYMEYFAYDMMVMRTGNCAHFAALLTVLLGHLGFDCRLIYGEVPSTGGTWVEHKWNYVLVDGEYYWLDVRLDHANYVRTGSINHSYFMVKSTAEWEKQHKWDHEYSNLLAANTSDILAKYGTAQSVPGAAGQTASPTRSAVYVDGSETKFDMYLIGGNNYIKLRDLAYVLNGSDKGFSVGYNDATKEITLTTGEQYSPVGGEMAKSDGQAKAYTKTTSAVYVNGKVPTFTAYVNEGAQTGFTAYNIGGNNYFKLRDLCAALDIGLTYNASTGAVGISTSQGYVAP